MRTIPLSIVTPESVSVQVEMEFGVFPGSEGELGVLPGHAPVIAVTKAGKVRITTAGNQQKIYTVAPGMVSIQPKQVTLFTSSVTEQKNSS